MSAAGCGVGCGCDPLAVVESDVANPPGQPSLAWRAAPHSQVLARLRARLGAAEQEPDVRALAGNATDDPAVAMLDAFAVVADTVSFYTERIAQEGFLRTATELRSVRLLARTTGYELRPGVAAEVELAFAVEDAPGAPQAVDVVAGTPAQSVPGPGELPQVFQTSADLQAHVAWNAVPGATSEPASPVLDATGLWLEGTSLGLRVGDPVLVVGHGRREPGDIPVDRDRDGEHWQLCTVTGVHEPAGPLTGWTRVTVHRDLQHRDLRRGRREPLRALDDVEVWTFGRRAGLFGAHAPNPALLTGADGEPPTGVENSDWKGIDDPRVGSGTNEELDDVIEVDGDQPRIVAGSRLVLQGPSVVALYRVEDVEPAGAARFALAGKLLRVHLDSSTDLDSFGRRETVVHCEARLLPAGRRPLSTTVPAEPGGRTLRLRATDPPLPVGRRVLLCGFAPGTVPTDPLVRAATPPPLAEPATVAGCSVDGTDVVVTLAADLRLTYDPVGLTVRGNLVTATHGETVAQVLGSGDATRTFQHMATRRPPLTHVRAVTTSGARSTLQVRVDGVLWHERESLDDAGPTDRVYTARAEEDGTVTVTTGDGVSGARLPTGTENVRATYRVGIGAPGALVAGQLSLLPRRPLGMRSVTNPAATHGWAPPEHLGQARTNAPLRTRTLDRAVSVVDHEDVAAGFAGVSLARADAVWDGRSTVVVVSVLATGGTGPEEGLLGDLAQALAAARDPGTRLLVLPGEPVRFGVRVDLAVDPDHPRADVEAAVRAALLDAFVTPAVRFAAPVTASRVLLTVTAVPGVLACTVPDVAPVTSPPGAPTVLEPTGTDVLATLPARWEPPDDEATTTGELVAAQAATLVPDGVQLGVMAP